MSKKINFSLDNVPNDQTGLDELALVKHTVTDGVDAPETWCTVNDLNRLFEVCSRRWDVNGWDLEKLITAVNECQFD